MRDSLGLRSVSMGASALVLTGLVFMAMNASWSVLQPQIIDRPIMTSVPEPVPPPVTPPDIEPPPLAANPIQGAVIGALVVPTLPTELTTIAIAAPDYAPVVLPEIVDPHWRRRPRDLARYYPSRALQRGTEGAVVLDCLVNQQGRLGCTVVSETPQGWDFGAAALRISQDYEMIPATRDGVPVDARYRMRVPFAIE